MIGLFYCYAANDSSIMIVQTDIEYEYFAPNVIGHTWATPTFSDYKENFVKIGEL